MLTFMNIVVVVGLRLEKIRQKSLKGRPTDVGLKLNKRPAAQILIYHALSPKVFPQPFSDDLCKYFTKYFVFKIFLCKYQFTMRPLPRPSLNFSQLLYGNMLQDIFVCKIVSQISIYHQSLLSTFPRCEYFTKYVMQISVCKY